MRDFLFLSSLLFNLSWVSALIWLQILRGAHKHYIFLVELVTWCMLFLECYREIIVLTWHVQTYVNAGRVYLYGVEHIFLGIVIREALLYVEQYQKNRKRSRSVR